MRVPFLDSITNCGAPDGGPDFLQVAMEAINNRAPVISAVLHSEGLRPF